MTTNQTIDGVPQRTIEWAFERLKTCQEQAFQSCECEQCERCGKMPDECSGTECSNNCQCSTCEHCSNELLMTELRDILDKPAAQPHRSPVVLMELVENKIYGGMHISKWDNPGALKEGFHRLYAEQPAPVAVVMSFDFEHPSSKERRTVELSKQDVFDGMEDYFYDKIGEQICRCESVGETNVVDCSCDEYVHDFEIVKASLTS